MPVPAQRAPLAQPGGAAGLLLSLQRAAGNRAVQGLVSGLPRQAAPLPVQRLVVVPGGVDKEAKRVYESDHALLNHISWALDTSGGP